jgi:pyruvate formate lyase activating enzyme
MDGSMSLTGIIFDIKRYAVHDGPGIRTTVFFKGCPLDCWWCHNPEGRSDKPEVFCVRTRRESGGKNWVEKKERFGRIVSVEEIMAEVAKDTIFYDQSGGGVTISGGEPLIQPDFLRAILAECRQQGIHTTVDTSGHAPIEAFKMINELVDLYLYDLKNMDDTEHIKYTGVSNKQSLDNLTLLAENGSKIQLRLPMIPGITDDEENIAAIMRFIEPLSGIQNISLLPYNRLAEDKRERFSLTNRLGKMATLSEAELDAVARKLTNCGYRVKIGG